VESLTDFFAGAHLADIALAALLGEGAVLLAYHRRTGRGLPAAELLSVLLPGGCLLLALRGALKGGGGVVVSVFLSAALVAHVADMWRRSRQYGVSTAARSRPRGTASSGTLPMP
jgi:hypothetical protein